jgi:NRAMP (natural resistance-associated macrophage protein)-like metal ion transporter
VITGAADDDPSGIATYSIAGAQAGTAFLWTALISWPLMWAVQLMCAQIGLVTGQGLSKALREKFPRRIVVAVAGALFVANTLNIGADLAGMADAAQMLSGLRASVLVVVFAGVIGWATVRFPYREIANVLKWLCLVLFAYVITAFIAVGDWRPILRDAFVPQLPHSREGWSTLVAILGTTISPYLFYWQTSEEVEEAESSGPLSPRQRQAAVPRKLSVRRLDVGAGTFSSNLVMFFIIVTTAATLHRHGITEIETSRQAAEALRPLAGQWAFALYTAGIIGTGLLAIPVLAGAGAYALAEALDWNEGLSESLGRARPFYGVILASILVGMALHFTHINPIKALYWTAVINGLLAPFLLVGIAWAASDRKLMRQQPSSRLSLAVVLATALAMFGAAAGMFFL